MITIYLLFQLFGGAVHDVDAFTTEAQCVEAYEHGVEALKEARKTLVGQRGHAEELKAYQILECQPLSVPAPVAREAA